MGMSTHVMGIRPADATFRKMRAVWDACDAAGITVPEDVLAFFNNERPDAEGVVVEIEKSTAVKRWKLRDSEGYEVDLTKLDPTVKIVRFYNSY